MEIIELIEKNQIQDLEDILKKNFDPNTRDEDGRTLLFHAVINKNLQIVKLLLEHGADPNAKDYEDRLSPIITAGGHGTKEIIELLMEHGADINVREGRTNDSILSNAVGALKNNSVIQTILDNGFDFSMSEGEILSEAAYWRNYEAIVILRNNGFNIDTFDGYNRTPLMVASLQADKTIVQYLLEQGANADLTDDEGNKASDYAREISGFKGIQIITLLESYEKINPLKQKELIHKHNLPEEAVQYLSGQNNLKFTVKEEFLQDESSPDDSVYIELFDVNRIREIRITIEPSYNHEDPNNEEEGFYDTIGLDLVKIHTLYSPTGVLVWLADLQSFGSYDPEHRELYIFDKITWDTIINNPSVYLNSVADDPESNIVSIFDCSKPWELWKFIKEDE